MTNAQDTQQDETESMKVDVSSDPTQHERVEHVERGEALQQGDPDYHFGDVTRDITAPGTEELGQEARGDDNRDGRDESKVADDADPQTDDLRGPATGH